MDRGSSAASGLGVCTRFHGLRTRRGDDSDEVPVHAMCAVSKETCRRRSQPPAAVHTGSESSALNAVLAVPDPYTRRRRRHDHPGGKHDEVVSLRERAAHGDPPAAKRRPPATKWSWPELCVFRQAKRRGPRNEAEVCEDSVRRARRKGSGHHVVGIGGKRGG